MNLINIDVTGKQTFFCIGKQYDHGVTAVVFRGVQLVDGEFAYLIVDGKQTLLERNTWLVERSDTAHSGDFKAQLVVEGPKTHRTVRTFTFRVEHVLYEGGELVGPNPGIVDKACVDKAVAEYVNDHQDMLKGDQGVQGQQGVPGPKGDPGNDATTFYSEKDEDVSIALDLGAGTINITGIHQRKAGNVVEIYLDAHFNTTGGDFEKHEFSCNLSDHIAFLPAHDMQMLHQGFEDAEKTVYFDCTAMDEAAFKPDGTLTGATLSGERYVTLYCMYLVSDTAGKIL